MTASQIPACGMHTFLQRSDSFRVKTIHAGTSSKSKSSSEYQVDTIMKIHGLQKMTLLDYPGYVACTVFLGGCDFRCPYCHNFELACGAAQPVMDDEELFAFLKKRKGLLDGVAITGGEPCLHKDLPELLRGIRALGFRTKLDTNGYHPEMLRHVLDEGLVDYVAMDIKNSPAKYAETAGFRYFSVEESAAGSESGADTVDAAASGADTDAAVNSGTHTAAAPLTDENRSDADPALTASGTRTVSSPYTSGDLTNRILNLGKIKESISLLINGTVDYEFRTTVVKEFHTAEDFFEIGEMIRGAEHYYLQCFTDRDTVPYGNLHAPSVETLQKYWRIMLDFVPGTELRGINEPA